MEINQGYLLVLLLASLSASCTSDCPTPEPYGQPLYDNCARLYNILERALLENPGNLYQLHDTLLPNSGPEPLYVAVSFELNEEQYPNFCWTSSALLRTVDPSKLASLQLYLINLLLLPVGIDGLIRAHDAQLSLNLKVNLTESDYPDFNATINDVLQELTASLKVYASTQRSRSFWTTADLQYKGYSCESTHDMELGDMFVSITVMVVVLTTLALIKVAPKLYQKVIERTNQWYSFFWAASFMVSLCNFFSVYGLVGFGIMHFLFPSVFSDDTCAIKMVMVCLLIFIDILVAIYIPKSAEFSIPSIAYCCTCCCCCCCCSKLFRSKWIQTVALTSLLLFTQLVVVSAVPTILWTFVFPVQTLAVVAFFAAANFCMTALIALLIRNIGRITRGGRWRDNWNTLQPLLILMVALFLAIVILTFIIYVKLITSGIATNQVGGYIVSFLPSAILTIIGWFVTKDKFFKQTPRQESDSTRNRAQCDSPTEQTPLLA